MRSVREIIYVAIDDMKDTPHQSMAAYWLKSKGWPVVAFAPLNSSKYIEIEDCIIENIGSKFYTKSLRRTNPLRLIRMVLFLNKVRGDRLVYIQGAPNGLLGLALKALGPCKPIIYHSQDFVEPTQRSFWQQIEKRICRYSDLVIWNELNRARIVKSAYGLKAMPLVVRTYLPISWRMPDPKDALKFDALDEIVLARENGGTLIFAGSGYSPKRCSDELLRALVLLPQSYIAVFSGDKDKEINDRFKKKINDLGLVDRVILTPRLAYRENLAVAANCDIGILLYPDDSLGNFYQQPSRLSEYVRLNLFIIASDFPSLRQGLCNYVYAEFCNAGSPEDICKAIERRSSRRNTPVNAMSDKLGYDDGGLLLEASLRKIFC